MTDTTPKSPKSHIDIPTAAEAIDRLLARALALCLAGRDYRYVIEQARMWALLEEATR